MNSALAVAQITGSHPLRADPVAFASLSKRLLAPLQKAAHLIADLFILQTTCDMGDLRERVGCRPVRVSVRRDGFAPGTRDNVVFEAGLFRGALGMRPRAELLALRLREWKAIANG